MYILYMSVYLSVFICLSVRLRKSPFSACLLSSSPVSVGLEQSTFCTCLCTYLSLYICLSVPDSLHFELVCYVCLYAFLSRLSVSNNLRFELVRLLFGWLAVCVFLCICPSQIVYILKFSVCLSISLSVSLSVCMSDCLSVCQCASYTLYSEPVCPSVSDSFISNLSDCLSVSVYIFGLSVCACQTVHFEPVCLYVYLSVCLSVSVIVAECCCRKKEIQNRITAAKEAHVCCVDT